ncbi:MAG: hypothetical protein NDI82_06745, partial [Anaeromyxobacteraceae bacterium]|nr:hypothetical protein [Anaeromyxobacteraceae bacterium]
MERILKAQQVAAWPRRRISALAWQAGEEADVILADARAEAEAVRRDAARGAERAREEAVAAGLAEGLGRAAAALLLAEARRDAILAAA